MPKSIIQDAIVLKNGDNVNGKVLTNIFNIKTSYGKIAIKRKEIATIHMKGTQFTQDQIITLELNKFTGVIQEGTIEVKLQNGQVLKIEKNKIHTLMMLTNRPF